MTAPRSLRGRLILAAAGSIVAAVAAFAVATVVLVGDELRGTLDSALRQRAEDVAQLAVSAPAVLSSPGALETPASGRQIVVQVLDAQGRILARSLTLGAHLLPIDPLAEQALRSGRAGFESSTVAGRSFRIYAAPVAQAGGPAAGGAVLVGSDTTDIDETLRHLVLVLTLTGLAIAAVAVLTAVALTRRGMSPLGRLATAAGEIERTADPSRRLPERDVGDEIGQLTGVLNRMLASLEASRASERRFLADASHELRTPVTALLGNVEYVARHGAGEDVIADLRRDAARLARLVDDLLALERASSTALEPAPVDLESLVDEVVASQDRSGGRVRRGEVQPVWVRGEREALGRVLQNLVENGLVHGPPGGEVTIELTARDGRALLTVRDEGLGPDTAHGNRLFERFWRAPDASGRPGSGLGLSIAQAIIDRHDGRLAVEGSSFTVELPAVAAG
ncbi:MAG: HAMP domain-containing histidine kinase [Actinomycetota bacterium]|nr:HAMP domain-containing histidine kinase [Actinomycetota bacterium]